MTFEPVKHQWCRRADGGEPGNVPDIILCPGSRLVPVLQLLLDFPPLKPPVQPLPPTAFRPLTVSARLATIHRFYINVVSGESRVIVSVVILS